MPYRREVFQRTHYYHIYNRGAGRHRIFFNSGNYEHCLRLMKRYVGRYEVAPIAYCLMPNHYHFLLRQEGDVPLGRFVNVLFNAYVQAVNKQQQRSGTLFEGRFKHVHVDRDEYLLHLCRYIHANPVKGGLVRDVSDWPFSNYHEWVGRRRGTLVDRQLVRSFFPDEEQYRVFVLEYLQGEEMVPDAVIPYLFEEPGC